MTTLRLANNRRHSGTSIIRSYAHAQASAVRRQADANAGTSALARLIKEMRDNADVLTRDYFVGLWDQSDERALREAHSAFDRVAADARDHLDPDIPRQDLETLQTAARKVSLFVDQHIAHDQATPTAEAPTFNELHAAIDSLGEIFTKYAAVLTATTYIRIEPVMQDDWKAIFRLPWLRGD